VIDFDAAAYMAAAAGPASARGFFYSRMVLSEGARVRCSKPGLEFGQQVSGGWLQRVGWARTTPLLLEQCASASLACTGFRHVCYEG